MLKVLRHRRIAQVIAAGAIGAIAGLMVFAVAHVTGRNLYIIMGALAGAVAVAVFVLQQYWRTAQLTEIKITVPQINELTFVVNNDARHVAWKLYIEVVTRISTQPLADEEGFIREALTSLYGLFGTTRDTLKASRPSVSVSGEQTVEHLAVTMLNNELRPFLSKWHPRLREFEKALSNGQESAWSDNRACRDELRNIQVHLLGFALGFARPAGVRDAQNTVRSVGRKSRKDRNSLGERLLAGRYQAITRNSALTSHLAYHGPEARPSQRYITARSATTMAWSLPAVMPLSYRQAHAQVPQ
jgi:hypothetical protein